MSWTRAALASLALLLATPAFAQAPSANDAARFLAGLPVASGSPLEPLERTAEWQRHARAFNSGFSDIEQRQLTKIRAWSRTNLTATKPTLLYMFSGPDFLYAQAFFPAASTYVLAALEPVGQVPDLTRMSPGELTGSLIGLRGSLRTLLASSFFKTKDMKTDLQQSRVSGTLPILYVFLARTGHTIRDVSLVNLDEQGAIGGGADRAPRSGAHGVKITFAGEDGRARTLYYFSGNVANDGLKKSGLIPFTEKLGEADSFLKSASYLPHSPNFTQVRDFLLQKSSLILEDDTGIPLTYFDPKIWQVKPYGNYVTPLGIFPGTYQPKMRELYRTSQVGAMDFRLGYQHGGQSSMLLATRR